MGEFKGGGATITMQNSASAFVITHELGHALGIGHSNYMLCQSGQSDGPWGTDCKAVEYGGTMDVMGNVETNAPLSTYHLWKMGLIADTEVKQSWLTETIELSAVDVATGTRAIFARDGSAVYWIEYRRARPESNYKAGLVIYRTDPPPISAVISPNPEDSFKDEFGISVGTDIWMLNFDDYTYIRSKANGSMTLPQGRTATVFSGNISIVASAMNNDDAVKVTITRKADTKAPETPILVNSNLWRFPGLEIIKAPYDDGESAIAKFQGRINEKIVDLTSDKSENFSPTYLNPFSAPKSVRVRDLPEGDYSLAIRAIDLWGNTSPWSETVKVSIDRGNPVVTSAVKINAANNETATFSWTGVKDEGSGLCLTQFVNEDGWVMARSTSKSAPTFAVNYSETFNAKAQVFDCIGNGMSAKFSAKASYISAAETKKTGKWTSTTVQGYQALKCVGRCSASITTSGTVSVLSGDGTADVFVTSKLTSKIPYSNQGMLRSSNSIELGKSNRVLRIQGSNFTLFGISRIDISISNVVESPRLPVITDPSLAENGQTALSKMGFNQDDFSSDWTVLPMYRGTTLLDPSLDLCTASYKSEADRSLRRQIAVYKQNSPFSFLSTEVVQYKSKAAANAALLELKANYEACVKAKGGIESSGTFTDYSFKPIQGTSKLVGEANRVLVNATIGKDIYARQLLAYYQFNGDTFSGLYLVKNGTSEFSKDEIARWTKVAETMAERLLNNS